MGQVSAPPPRPRRRPQFAVDVIDDVLTNPRRLSHGRPHPESFSRPRSRQAGQPNEFMLISTRAQRFADPRRRITGLEVRGWMAGVDARGVQERGALYNNRELSRQMSVRDVTKMLVTAGR